MVTTLDPLGIHTHYWMLLLAACQISIAGGCFRGFRLQLLVRTIQTVKHCLPFPFPFRELDVQKVKQLVLGHFAICHLDIFRSGARHLAT